MILCRYDINIIFLAFAVKNDIFVNQDGSSVFIIGEADGRVCLAQGESNSLLVIKGDGLSG